MYFKADPDIDCDGRPGTRCDRGADPYFSHDDVVAQGEEPARKFVGRPG
ncbi:hypothetical protein [Streptomyces griseoluteus]|nr:hypothetical protein [Streptomyces griseoluteus]GHE99479.1 hypothetical protein GCM10017776_15440 [Streptomyces griseoluteus]